MLSTFRSNEKWEWLDYKESIAKQTIMIGIGKMVMSAELMCVCESVRDDNFLLLCCCVQVVVVVSCVVLLFLLCS
jgi:hypothetical protein